MAIIKSYTDLSQSKTLSKILPLESADMRYQAHYDSKSNLKYVPRFISTIIPLRVDIPCWSLAALISVLPDELEDNYFLSLQKERDEYCCCYEDINGDSFTHIFADNPVDACVEMIIHLNELKML